MKAKSRQYFFAPVLVLTQWTLAALGVWSLALLVIIPAALIWSIVTRRTATAVLIVLLSPLTVAFDLGAYKWAHASSDDDHQSYILHSVYSDRGLTTVDPLTRLPRVPLRVLAPRGDEWVFLLPHDGAINFLSMIFGPARGAYDGPMPSLGEMRMALAAPDAVPIRWEDLAHDRVPLGAPAPLALEPGLGALLLDGCGYAFEPTALPSPPEQGLVIRATLWRGRALLLQMHNSNDPLNQDPLIVLIDAVRGRQFGYFNGGACNRLPLVWRAAGISAATASR